MILKRGNSRYYSYKFMYRGEMYSESTRQSNAKVAKEIEAAKRAELAKGEVGIYEKKQVPTLREFCEKWFTPRISATVGGFIKQKTWDDFYATGITALLAFEPFATARLDEIDSELVGRFATARRSQGAKGKAVNTVNSNLRVLRRVLNKAVEWHNPKKGVFLLDKAPAFDLLKGANKRDRVVTFKEESAYLVKAEIESPLLSDFVSQLFDTAIRPEEGYRLQWEAITWDGGVYGESTMRIRHGKTEAARREIPISPRVLAMLRARWKAAGKPQQGWVWPNKETASGHIEPSTLKKIHAKACKQAKIKPFVLYDARHTSLTRLGCSGCDAWTLARIAGHSKIQMSMTYVHSQYMEGAGWWGQWWEDRKNGRKPTMSATGAEIRYTGNVANGEGNKSDANIM
jgi:integrase